MTDTESVEKFIYENEPVLLESIQEKYGGQGVKAVRTLMENNRVSFTIDWKLHTDDRNSRFK